MGARVITVTSGKGGVGKTTATANLAVALAALGNKVVCIDADIGLRNLDVVMGLENRIVYDLVDVVEGRARLRQAMIKDKRLKEELYLIPAAQTRDKTAVSPSDMLRVCEELKPIVDYVLIDSPAGIERGFRNAIAPADEVLIVTNPEVSSVRDADRIIGLIEAEGKGPGRLIVNRVKPEMVKRGDMLSPDDIIDILAIELIGLVPEDEGILVSTNRGLPVAMQMEESRSGQAFRNIARRVMGEDVEFLPLEEETGFFQKLFGKKKSGGAKAEPQPQSKKAEPKPAPARSVIEEEEEEVVLPARTVRVEEPAAPPARPAPAPVAPAPAAPVVTTPPAAKAEKPASEPASAPSPAPAQVSSIASVTTAKPLSALTTPAAPTRPDSSGDAATPDSPASSSVRETEKPSEAKAAPAPVRAESDGNDASSEPAPSPGDNSHDHAAAESRAAGSAASTTEPKPVS